jgi:Lysyl oxidase
MVPWTSRHGPRRPGPQGSRWPPDCLPRRPRLPSRGDRIIVRPQPTRRRSRTLVAGLVCVISAVVGASTWPSSTQTVAAAAPADRLPDLAMAYPTELRIQTTSSGARRLRFTTMIVNIGDGPFETRSSRLAGNPTMGVNQRIYNNAGGYRVFDTTATAKYSGDGHDHWHVQDVARYELFAINGKGPALRRDAKVGFCFFDTNAYRLSLPRAPRSPVYLASGCGRRSSLFVRNGISVGWGDKYGWRLSRQWIYLSSLPPGDYFLKVTVDPLFQYQEIRHRNNCNWSRIRISRNRSVVPVLDRGFSCVLPA